MKYHSCDSAPTNTISPSLLHASPSGSIRVVRILAVVGYMSFGPLLGAACQGGQGEIEQNAHVATVDSAGVEIVTSAAPEWRSEREWVIDPNPIAHIGAVEGEGRDLLHDVGGATRLSGGRVAIVNRGTFEILVYSAEGVREWAFGGEGDGPEEFRSLGALRRLDGDTLLLFDSRRRRQVWIEPGSGLVRDRTIDSRVDRPAAAYPMSDASVLFSTVAVLGGSGLPEGLFHVPSSIVRWSPGEDAVDTVFVGKGRQVYSPGRGFLIPIVADNGVARFGYDGFQYGGASGREFRRYSERGELERIVRWNGPDRTLSDMERTRLREALIESADNEVLAQRTLSTVPVPNPLPPYDRISGDATGATWLYTRSLPPGWFDEAVVFDADGHWLGSVTLPPIESILEIGEDYLIALVLDEFDVESVQLFSLRR